MDSNYDKFSWQHINIHGYFSNSAFIIIYLSTGLLYIEYIENTQIWLHF